jgi:hypothetical protein
MRKIIVPLMVFALGLFVADYFFGVDVPELFEGFGDFVVNLLKGSRK